MLTTRVTFERSLHYDATCKVCSGQIVPVTDIVTFANGEVAHKHCYFDLEVDEQEAMKLENVR